MSLREVWQEVRDNIKGFSEPLEDEATLRVWAERAYACYIEWFGPPPDPRRPYFLYKVKRWTSGCGYSFGSYGIGIADQAKTPEQRCLDVAHEMYHRVTMRRRGLRDQRWADEMLAMTASRWFLKDQGFQEYSDDLGQLYVDELGKVDVPSLRAARLRKCIRRVLAHGQGYSAGFYHGVARLGLALTALVGRKGVCRMVTARSLNEWLGSFEPGTRSAVCRILEVPHEPVELADAQARGRLGFALFATGDHEAAVAEFRKAILLDPDNVYAHFQMAFALKRTGQREAACEAWRTAAHLDTTHSWAAYNVADYFHSRHDYAAAIEWYREALRRKPDWVRAYYWLGAALAYHGSVAEARACWERVIALASGGYAKSARKSLNNWPLTTPAGGPPAGTAGEG